MTVAELTAGCHDSSTAALAHGDGQMLFLEYLLKLFDTGWRGSFEFSAGILVEGDEINLGPESSQKFGQLLRCLGRVVDSPEEKIFESDPVTPRQFQAAAGLQQFLQRITSVDGHDTRSGLVVGSV